MDRASEYDQRPGDPGRGQAHYMHNLGRKVPQEIPLDRKDTTMTTATTVSSDLRIDAFEYARKHRELMALSERIKAASKEAGLHKLVFFDGLEHFQLESPVLSDGPLRVKSLECIDQQ